MQHDAAHVGVVEIEHVAHLAVGERRFGDAELELVAEHRRLRLRVQRLQHRQQLADRRMPAAGERAADPVEHAAARLVHGRLGQILEAEARQERREIARDVQAERRRAVVGFGGRLQSHRDALTA